MSTLVVSRHKIINVDTLSRLRVGLVLAGCKGRVQTRLKICVGWLSPVWTRLCRPWSQLTPFTIDFWARQHNICWHGRSMKPTGATTKSIFYFRKRKRVLVFWFMVFVTYALVNNASRTLNCFVFVDGVAGSALSAHSPDIQVVFLPGESNFALLVRKKLRENKKIRNSHVELWMGQQSDFDSVSTL